MLSYAFGRHSWRRVAIEAEIVHMQGDGLLGRNFLEWMAGDDITALLCGGGHNIWKILAHPRALLRLALGEPRKAVEGHIVLLEAGGSPQKAFTIARFP